MHGSSERIGVLGGTFDPPHVGHLETADAVSRALNLDRMLLMVAGDPWQKTALGPVTPAADRLAMVAAAVAEVDGLEVSELEVARTGPSYMVDTLESLRLLHPDAELFLVIGSDTAEGLGSWHEPDRVAGLATTAIVERGGRSGGRPPEGWPYLVVDAPQVAVSSSEIRERIAAGESVQGLVPDAVIEVIDSLGLYREGP